MAFIYLIIGCALVAIFLRQAFRFAHQKACFSPQIPIQKELNLDADEEELKILCIGDIGTGDEHQKRVAEASAQTCEINGCDLVLLLGDNFIQHGVSSIEDTQFQKKFESMYPQQLPFYAILGNHDLRGNWQAQIEYTNHSQRWIMPDVNYTFEAGPVLFQGINTSCTLCSLWTLLRPKTKPWKVVFGHHPFMTTGRHRGMTWLERAFILRSKADFYLAGHNHVLEHFYYQGLDVMVSGGGGSPLNKIDLLDSPYRKFMLQDHGYLWMRFTKKLASIHVYDSHGNQVYHFERGR